MNGEINMVSKLAKSMTDFISDDDVFDRAEYDIYKYGFTLMIEILLVTIVSVFLACLMGKLQQCIVFYLAFIPLRRYGGGYHLSSFRKCFLLSVSVYELILLAATYLKLNSYLLIVNYIIIFLLFIIGPSFNETINFDNSRKKKYKLKYRLILLIIGIIFIIMYKNNDELNAGVIFMTLLLNTVSGMMSRLTQYTVKGKTT